LFIQYDNITMQGTKSTSFNHCVTFAYLPSKDIPTYAAPARRHIDCKRDRQMSWEHNSKEIRKYFERNKSKVNWNELMAPV